MDYRLLRQNGFKLRDLTLIHNFTFLSVYASTIIAAITPTIIALMTGRINEVVTFFLETVLIQTPAGGP